MLFMSSAMVAGLTSVLCLLGGVVLGGASSELFVILGMASGAMALACLIGALASTSSSSLAVDLAKATLGVGAALALAPFVFMTAFFVLIVAIPVGLCFLPLVAWDAFASDDGHGGHADRGRMVPKHA